jgi:antitoxin component of MazEF toxin-antitoxin module
MPNRGRWNERPNDHADARTAHPTWSQTTNICSLRGVDTPYGPREITKFRQVSLPKDLMDRAHLQPGDKVYVAWNDALPGSLLVIPIEIVSEWIRLGRQTYESERPDVRHETTDQKAGGSSPAERAATTTAATHPQVRQ